MKAEISKDGVLSLTFDAPPVNALRIVDLKAMQSALAEAPQNDVRGIVLSGAGGGFCAGLHREVFEADRVDEAISILSGIVGGLINSDVPSAAAINGACIGAGMVFALTCDYRVASSRSQFSLPELSLGVPVSARVYGLVYHWAGAATARDICMDGITLSAESAMKKGFVDRLAYPDQCESQAKAWVSRMLRLPTVAMRATHSQVRSRMRGL